MNKPSFLNLPRPILVCITGETTIEANIANIRNAEYEGAHAFAIHLEKVGQANHSDEALRRMAGCTRKPVMMLHYRDAGALPRAYTDEERMDLLRRAIRCGAACVDLTGDTFNAGDCEFTENSRAVDMQRKFIDEIHELGGEVIMSSHIQRARRCDEVVQQMLAIEKRGCDIAKIVTVADTEDEFVDASHTESSVYSPVQRCICQTAAFAWANARKHADLLRTAVFFGLYQRSAARRQHARGSQKPELVN